MKKTTKKKVKQQVKTKKVKKSVVKNKTEKKVPVSKTLELWMDGKCVERFSKSITEAIKYAREKAKEHKKKTFISYGGMVRHGFDEQGKKYSKGMKARKEHHLLVEKRKRGGAPKKSEKGAIAVSISMSKEDNERFEKYCDKFAGGNKSEMFRRILNSWENMMVQVVGEQS